VVWQGHQPGIYRTWPEAQAQVREFKAAKYKSFTSLAEAENAYSRPWQEFYKAPGEKSLPKVLSAEFLDEIVADSIAVDAACSGNPGKMEYRGVYTLAPEVELFRSPVFDLGTNNIGEFLALVHALAMYSKEKPDLTIYSDSRLAMKWIKVGKCRTKLVRNAKTAKLYQIIRRAENWLANNKWKNPVLKWETKRWGEIPADFGRK